jgi:hypothetical protein
MCTYVSACRCGLQSIQPCIHIVGTGSPVPWAGGLARAVALPIRVASLAARLWCICEIPKRRICWSKKVQTPEQFSACQMCYTKGYQLVDPNNRKLQFPHGYCAMVILLDTLLMDPIWQYWYCHAVQSKCQRGCAIQNVRDWQAS